MAPVPKFSANLGFLWTDRPLVEAIRAAGQAGFDAVELHWPYQTDPAEIRAALQETGLPVLALNTVKGDVSAGEFGLGALPGREKDAREAIDQAFYYGRAIGVSAVHVMAGKASGPDAERAFIENLRYASIRGAEAGIRVLIEPLNAHDVPGYFLSDPDAAARIIAATGCDNIFIMFDCYHMALMGHDLVPSIRQHLKSIGHIQIAAVPDRGEPDQGIIDYAGLLPAIVAEGYGGYFGAEYRPRRSTQDGIAWLALHRADRLHEEEMGDAGQG